MHRQRLSEEERRLDKLTTISKIKAGLITCLFLLVIVTISTAQNSTGWLNKEIHQKAYEHLLNLDLNGCRETIGSATEPESLYLLSLADALELLISEDLALYDRYEPRYSHRIESLKAIQPVTEKSLIAQAEIRLHWAFVYLKFGHDFTSAWNVRQAHLTVQECLRKFPQSKPILKTSGILEVMLGSVPEKYQWILGILGMKGSVETGLSQLTEVMQKQQNLAFESTLLYLLIDGFILQQTDTALQAIESIQYEQPDNRLILFLGASLAIKNSTSEMAMIMLEKLKSLPNSGLPIFYADYLLGEVYLHQGNYAKSIQAYQNFLINYKGKNYIKDANYKIGMAYWLNHRSEQARIYFDRARASGRAVVEADQYAARALEENALPNIKLTKARYSTDGGYYDEAIRLLKSIKKEELPTEKDGVEYAYRFARLYHKINSLEQAKTYYHQTIELSKNSTWYFAPNSCLQLGYIYAAEKNKAKAEQYFRQALTYRKHEYQNSIDSKAKSALDHLKHTQ